MEPSPSLTLFELAGQNPQVRFSPHCWKIRMALAHKGLEAERIAWRFHEKERIAAYGHATVPIMLEGDQVIADSWNIALHLESRYAKRPSLFNGTGSQPLAAFINAWTDTRLQPAMVRIILLDVFKQLHPDDREYFRASRQARFGAPLEEFVADSEKHILELNQRLAPLRQILKQQAFIAGDAPAYADYCVFGIFMWARCTSAQTVLEESDPVFTWRERLLDAFGGLARSAPVALG